MNRHLIALITFLTLIPLVYYIPPALDVYLMPLLTEYGLPVRLSITIIAVAIIVPIISYLVIPTSMKLYTKMKVEKPSLR
jgi:antibiotic biosynthesis monooxygenase (ABM) superfamily enzyme